MSLSIYNSTNNSLLDGETFTGQWDNILDFSQICISSKASNAYTLNFYFSQNKETINYTQTQFIAASAETQFFNVEPLQRYFKIEVAASSGDITTLNLQTIYKTAANYQSNLSVNVYDPILDSCVSNSNVNCFINSNVNVFDYVLDSCVSNSNVNCFINSNVNVFDYVLDSCVSNSNVNCFINSNVNVLNQSLSDMTFATGNLNVNIASQTPLSYLVVKDKPTTATSLNNILATASQLVSGSPGNMYSIQIIQVGGSGTSYVKFYNSASASSASSPIATLAVHKDSSTSIVCNMNFSNALCVRATDQWAVSDNTNPSGTIVITAFINGYHQ